MNNLKEVFDVLGVDEGVILGLAKDAQAKAESDEQKLRIAEAVKLLCNPAILKHIPLSSSPAVSVPPATAVAFSPIAVPPLSSQMPMESIPQQIENELTSRQATALAKSLPTEKNPLIIHPQGLPALFFFEPNPNAPQTGQIVLQTKRGTGGISAPPYENDKKYTLAHIEDAGNNNLRLVRDPINLESHRLHHQQKISECQNLINQLMDQAKGLPGNLGGASRSR